MASAADKAAMRVRFGKNGIKDGFGTIIRTDHPTFGDIFDGSMSRQEVLDRRIEDAITGNASSSRAIDLFKKQQ